jgi:hypothetical protein
MTCPKCGSTEARPSRHSKWKDIFHSLLGQQAQRCRSCHARFYAPEQPQSTATPAPASASENSRKRRNKKRGGSRSRRRHLIEAGIFAVMMIIFIVCLLFITRQRDPGQQSNFISSSFDV